MYNTSETRINVLSNLLLGNGHAIITMRLKMGQIIKLSKVPKHPTCN